jgi:hypothetical protein
VNPQTICNRCVSLVGLPEIVTSFRNYRIRALLYAGKPNWDLLAMVTPP